MLDAGEHAIEAAYDLDWAAVPAGPEEPEGTPGPTEGGLAPAGAVVEVQTPPRQRHQPPGTPSRESWADAEGGTGLELWQPAERGASGLKPVPDWPQARPAAAPGPGSEREPQRGAAAAAGGGPALPATTLAGRKAGAQGTREREAR